MFSKPNKTLQHATYAILLSAVLHALAIFSSNNVLSIPSLIGATIFYTLIAWALSSNRRWLSYTVFIITLCGGVLATSTVFNAPIFGLIAITDFSCALFLAMHLWNK